MRVASVRGIDRDAKWRGRQQLLPRADIRAVYDRRRSEEPFLEGGAFLDEWSRATETVTADILSAPLAQEGTIVARQSISGQKVLFTVD